MSLPGYEKQVPMILTRFARFDSEVEALKRGGHQPQTLFVWLANKVCLIKVSMVSLMKNTDIHVNNIPVLQRAQIWNSVTHNLEIRILGKFNKLTSDD